MLDKIDDRNDLIESIKIMVTEFLDLIEENIEDKIRHQYENELMNNSV